MFWLSLNVRCSTQALKACERSEPGHGYFGFGGGGDVADLRGDGVGQILPSRDTDDQRRVLFICLPMEGQR